MKEFNDLKREFLNIFKNLDNSRSKSENWTNFIFLASAAFKNSVKNVSYSFYSQKIEDEYLKIINQYEKNARNKFCELLGLFINMADLLEPQDLLGNIFMELELGDSWKGQFFTPSSVSNLMAKINFPNLKADLGVKDFLTISDPACGAGSTLLACINIFIQEKINPSNKLFIYAQDIDRTAALMCYIQLTLWHIPAIVCVGNSLKNEVRELWHTPSYVFNSYRFKNHIKENTIKTSNFVLIGDPY